jgi:hypothetical protein
MEEELGLAWREALRRGRIHLERLSAHAPDYLAALKGLAKGAKISEEEAGLLDARYEIFYSAYAKEAGQECTSLAVSPSEALIVNLSWRKIGTGFLESRELGSFLNPRISRSSLLPRLEFPVGKSGLIPRA